MGRTRHGAKPISFGRIVDTMIIKGEKNVIFTNAYQIFHFFFQTIFYKISLQYIN